MAFVNFGFVDHDDLDHPAPQATSILGKGIDEINQFAQIRKRLERVNLSKRIINLKPSLCFINLKPSLCFLKIMRKTMWRLFVDCRNNNNHEDIIAEIKDLISCMNFKNFIRDEDFLPYLENYAILWCLENEDPPPLNSGLLHKILFQAKKNSIRRYPKSRRNCIIRYSAIVVKKRLRILKKQS